MGHLGNIYEGLLSLRLSVADRDYDYDPGSDRYLPADEPDGAEVHRGELLWLTDEGGRSRSASSIILPASPVMIEAVQQESMDRVLRELVGQDAPRLLSLEPETDGEFAGLLGREVDASLREALQKRLIEGERQAFAGPDVVWSNPRLRVEGMRELGEWPPAEGEHLPGPWDLGYWGQRALPALQRLSESPPAQGFVLGPEGGMDDEGWTEWFAVLRLREAGLIDGDLQQGGLSDVRVTRHGTRTLNPPERDPLAVAEVALRQGSKADATIAGVEEALGGRLKELAQDHGASLVDSRGGTKTLAVLNNDLRRTGVYDEAERAQIEAWLKLRNEVGHGRGQAVSTRRIETMLAGVRVFLQVHPSALSS